MNTSLEMVAEFHRAFRRPINTHPTIHEGLMNNMRVALIQEELNELEAALAEGDLVGVLDALSDLQYVLDGAYLDFGLTTAKQPAFEEVHRSNMTKLDENGKPILRADGKILKSDSYEEPNLIRVLNKVFPALF